MINESIATLTNVRLQGRLHLKFDADGATSKTNLKFLDQQPPLRVIRAFELENGGALVHLHNVSGGVLGGDMLDLKVEVGPKASAQLTTTSATRLYRCRDDAPYALQTTHLEVGENGLLEMLPDPIIPYAGSRYRQETTIKLAPGAGLFWWETIAPGREARGEVFDYDWLDLKLTVSNANRPIAIEQSHLQPKRDPLSSLARLGSYRYSSTFYICRADIDSSFWLALETELSEIGQQLSQEKDTIWAVSTLVQDGLVVRALSRSGRQIAPGLLAFWRAAKLALYGQEAVLPRKIY